MNGRSPALILSTGCRAGEILGLEWSRVDLTRKVAWLDHGTTKSGDGRGIPLNADAVAALEATRGQHPRWCFTFSGKRIQQSSTAWDKAKQRVGIEEAPLVKNAAKNATFSLRSVH
jgi:integrase